MKVKKSYLNNIKDTLKCYPLLQLHLEQLEENLKMIRNNDGMFGVSYKNTRVQTSKINRITENTAIDNIENERELLKEIAACNKKMYTLKSALNPLKPLSKKVIKLRYELGKSWFEISDELLYSDRQCRNKLDDGISDLAIIFYGEKVLEEKIS